MISTVLFQCSVLHWTKTIQKYCTGKLQESGWGWRECSRVLKSAAGRWTGSGGRVGTVGTVGTMNVLSYSATTDTDTGNMNDNAPWMCSSALPPGDINDDDDIGGKLNMAECAWLVWAASDCKTENERCVGFIGEAEAGKLWQANGVMGRPRCWRWWRWWRWPRWWWQAVAS